MRAAQAAGKAVGRPRRVYRRDVARDLRAAGASWRAISAELGVPVATLLDHNKQGVFAKVAVLPVARTEKVPSSLPVSLT